MKDFLESAAMLILFLGVVVALLAFSKWAFELICNSNLPMWLKWFLLK